MILSVKVPDETYETYGRQNPKNPREAIERVIEKYASIGSGKVLILTGENLSSLQKLIGQVDEAEQVVQKVAKSISINVGSLSFPLSESQLKGLKDKAAFFSKTPEQFAAEQIHKALQNALGV